MRSASRYLAILACACLLAGGVAACSTTQDKAKVQKAKSEHILKVRAERQKARQRHKKHAHHHHKKEKGK